MMAINDEKTYRVEHDNINAIILIFLIAESDVSQKDAVVSLTMNLIGGIA